MFAALLSFAGALVYGSADFLGGLASRRLRAVVVTATAALSGLVVLLAVQPLLGGTWAPEDIMWGALSGVAGAIAIGLLYACLAIGPMSILSPVTAVVSAVAPMLWGLVVNGERLTVLGDIGLVLALVAIVLVAFLPGEAITRPTLRGLMMAIGSGIAIGAFLVLIDQTSPDSGVVPLILNRAVNGVITGTIAAVLVIAVVRRGLPVTAGLIVGAGPVAGGIADAGVAATPTGHADLEAHSGVHIPLRRAWLLAVACGIVDSGANVLLLIALHAGGDLAVVSALTALYPAGTVLLASLVLRERIARVQWLGLALALTAGVLLAVG